MSRHGTTLPELLLLMLLIGVLTALAVPATRQAREQAAVRGARDALAAALARAQLAALGHGSSRVEVVFAEGVVRLEAPVGVGVEAPLQLGNAFGVVVVADHASGASVAIEFDGLGIGRIASRTFRFRRGASEARLTLSSYGRPRRW